MNAAITIAIVAGLAHASDTSDPSGRAQLIPDPAPDRGGHVYINYHTGERVITPHALPRVGRSERGSAWAGWGNSYPDPCDPNTNTDEQSLWFFPLLDEELGDEPMPNVQAVTAWQDWLETPGDVEFSIISFVFATFVPDPDPEGGAIVGHDMYLAFTENDRATERSNAVAHSPIAVTGLPGDINDGAGTLWFISVDLDPDRIELGDTDGSTTNPQGVDLDGDGLIDSGYIFTYNQPGVGEGDLLAARFPELAGAYNGFTDPLDTDTFANIVNMGPALAYPSGNAGVNGEPNCYGDWPFIGEWPLVPGCDDSPPFPLGTWNAFGLIDATGTDTGSIGGFVAEFFCNDNGPGFPFSEPWATPFLIFGDVDLIQCPADMNGDNILDLADITAFVTFFQSGDPAADIAPPTGVLDLADISLFVQIFQAGCP